MPNEIPNNIDIKALTHSAELGNGSDIKQAVANLPVSERRDILNDILEQSNADRTAQPTLPKLEITDFTYGGDSAGFSLEITPHGLFADPQTIYSDLYDASSSQFNLSTADVQP